MMISFAAAIGGAALADWRIVQEYESQRTACLVAGIVAGIGMAACLGGAMHYVDAAPGDAAGIFLGMAVAADFAAAGADAGAGKAATAAIVLGAVATMHISNLKIPGPDYMVLYRGWEPSSNF